MNEPENKAADSNEIEELKKQCAGLQRQGTILLTALAGVSLTVTAFIGLQNRRADKELQYLRPQARMAIEASAKAEPNVAILRSKLMEYGRTHPDYARILQKYQWMSNAVPPAPAPKK